MGDIQSMYSINIESFPQKDYWHQITRYVQYMHYTQLTKYGIKLIADQYIFTVFQLWLDDLYIYYLCSVYTQTPNHNHTYR